MDRRIKFFDTTLRDGEQSPGCSMNLKEKVKMAKRLEKLNVDVIEAGFAISSDGDFESIKAIAEAVEKPVVASLARALKGDIATVLNIPDTVGYTTPDEFYELVKYVKNNIIKDVDISVHCHNDLGLAVANSLSAIKAGANQVECTINGIGERAGNAALEEIVMVLDTRKDYFNYSNQINTEEIMKASKKLISITGVDVQPNKAIVGKNAFSHEAGIHQHGVLENKSTYEIMTPEKIGLKENKMVLGKHSGKHAFEEKVISLGYNLNDEEILKAFKIFKDVADKKKEIYNSDIEAIIRDDIYEMVDKVVLDAFNAIEKIFKINFILKDYKIKSVSKGKDALGEARVQINYNGKIVNGKGLSTDVIEASIKAYINAVNKVLI